MRRITHLRFIVFIFTSLALVGVAAIFALIDFGSSADPYVGYAIAAISVSGALFIYGLVRGWQGRRLRRIYRVPTGIWAVCLIAVAIMGFSYTGPAIYKHYFMSTNPYLTWIADQDPSSAIMVCWVTSFALESIVRYGTSPSHLPNIATAPEITRYHHVGITGLLPNTTYYYEAGGNPLKQFTTAPTGEFNFSFYVWSDPRENNGIETAIHRPNTPLEMYKDALQYNVNPAFSICTGDITSNSQDYDTWNLWFQDITTNDWGTNSTVALAVGNHERHDDPQGNIFQEYYPLKKQADGRFWYSFNYGDVHFIVLDPYKSGAEWLANFTAAQLAWLEADLAANSAQKYKIGLLHPPVLNGAGVQDDLQCLAGQYNISLFLTGHNHLYNHQVIDNVHYIVEGIGGNANNNYAQYDCSTAFTRISVSATEMDVLVKWINGTILDQFTILPPSG